MQPQMMSAPAPHPPATGKPKVSEREVTPLPLVLSLSNVTTAVVFDWQVTLISAMSPSENAVVSPCVSAMAKRHVLPLIKHPPFDAALPSEQVLAHASTPPL